VRLVAFASLLGTTIEWYDFFVFGLMSGIVFNKLYFPSDNEFISALLAWTGFAAGFVVRPIGGMVFGHYGDRIGRKPLLVTTVIMMGLATFLIGLVPTYAQIGIAAPILLLLCRLIQGFAVGGEWGGAVLMAFEFAPKNRRGFYASFPQMGLALGLCIASGVIALLSSSLTPEAFLSWGWRIAFFASIVLLAVGLYIRLKVVETPDFERIKAQHKVTRVPLTQVIQEYPGNILLGWGARLIDGIWFTVLALFSIPWLVGTLHFPRTAILGSVTTAAAVLTVAIPLASLWSDYVGHRRMYIWFSLVLAAIAFPTLWVMQQNPTAAGVAIVLGLGVVYAPVYGPQAALFCESFDTRLRYSGISIVYQIGALFSVSLTPVVATALLHANGNQPWYIAVYIVAAGIISAICAGLLKLKA
jgi:MFS family permease